MEVSTVVFARGGSKGLPGKNLMSFRGVPLIAHTIRLAKTVPGITTIYCSTDSPEIAEIAENEGAKVPFLRPPSLATDTSPEIDSWKHFARYLLDRGMAPDGKFVSLPATAPLRNAEDVGLVLKKLSTGDADLVVTYAESPHNPWFNMVGISEDGALSIGLSEPGKKIVRRQDAPKLFALVPVAYGTSLEYVMRARGLFDGRVVGVQVPRERSIDIDSRLDFQIAECLEELKEKMLSQSKVASSDT